MEKVIFQREMSAYCFLIVKILCKMACAFEHVGSR